MAKMTAIFRRRQGWLHLPALFLGGLLVHGLGNGRVHLWDRDEPRYAAAARTMLETGDWIVPYFNGTARMQKPVFSYWLTALSFRLLGESEFAARLGSVLAVAGTITLVGWLGAKMFGRCAGLCAASILATAPLTFFLAKLCIPDGCQLLFATGGYACLYLAQLRDSRGIAVTFWVLLALAVLTKGPVVPAMIASTLVVYRLTAGTSPRDFHLYPAAGLSIFAATVLPWLAAMWWASGPLFWSESIGRQIVRRAIVAFDGRFLPPGYYVVTLLVGFAPWIPLVLLASARQRSEWRRPGPVGFLIAWAIGPMLLLDLFPSKQMHYYAPSYPALALLTGGYLARVLRGELAWPGARLGRVYRTACVFLGMLAAALLTGLAILGPAGTRLAILAIAGVLAGGTVLSARYLDRGALGRAFAGHVSLLAGAWMLVGGWLLPRFDAERVLHLVAHRLAEERDRTGARPLLHKLFEPSLVYYASVPGERHSAPVIVNCFHDQQLLARLSASETDLLVPMPERDFERLVPLLDGQAEIIETWDGWVKMHPDRVHLVRLHPPRCRVAGSGRVTRR